MARARELLAAGAAATDRLDVFYGGQHGGEDIVLCWLAQDRKQRDKSIVWALQCFYGVLFEGYMFASDNDGEYVAAALGIGLDEARDL